MVRPGNKNQPYPPKQTVRSWNAYTNSQPPILRLVKPERQVWMNGNI